MERLPLGFKCNTGKRSPLSLVHFVSFYCDIKCTFGLTNSLTSVNSLIFWWFSIFDIIKMQKHGRVLVLESKCHLSNLESRVHKASLWDSSVCCQQTSRQQAPRPASHPEPSTPAVPCRWPANSSCIFISQRWPESSCIFFEWLKSPWALFKTLKTFIVFLN